MPVSLVIPPALHFCTSLLSLDLVLAMTATGFAMATAFAATATAMLLTWGTGRQGIEP